MKKTAKRYLFIFTLIIIILTTYVLLRAHKVKLPEEISTVYKVRIMEVLSITEHSLREEEINYICSLLDTEVLWEPIEWDEKMSEEITPEIEKKSDIITEHYEILSSGIIILCNVIDNCKDRDILMDKITLAINKLLNEQSKDGSWYGETFVLYTSLNIRALNYYYNISNDKKVLFSIKKANSWFVEGYRTSRNNMRSIYACFYSNFVYNLPEGLREESILKELKEIYLKKGEEIFGFEGIILPDPTFIPIALLNSDLLNVAEKEKLSETIIRIIGEKTKGFKDFNNLGPSNNIRCGYYLLNCWKYANPEKKPLIKKLLKQNAKALRKFLE